MKTIVKHRNAFDSLYKRTPSLFYLESIEPTEVQAIERDDFFNLVEHDPSVRKLYEEKLIDRLDDFFNLVEHDPSVRKLYEEKLIDRFHAYQQLFLSAVFTGTVLHIAGHGNSHELWHTWASAHIVASVLFTVLITFHVRTHWGWYRSLFRNGLGRKSHVTVAVSLIFIILAFSGYALLGVNGALDRQI